MASLGSCRTFYRCSPWTVQREDLVTATRTNQHLPFWNPGHTYSARESGTRGGGCVGQHLQGGGVGPPKALSLPRRGGCPRERGPEPGYWPLGHSVGLGVLTAWWLGDKGFKRLMSRGNFLALEAMWDHQQGMLFCKAATSFRVSRAEEGDSSSRWGLGNLGECVGLESTDPPRGLCAASVPSQSAAHTRHGLLAWPRAALLSPPQGKFSSWPPVLPFHIPGPQECGLWAKGLHRLQ